MLLTDYRNRRWPYVFKLRSRLHGQQIHVIVLIDFDEEGKPPINCGTLQMSVDQWQGFGAELGYEEPLSALLQEQIKQEQIKGT